MPSVNPKVIQELRELQSADSPRFLAELIDLFLKESEGHLGKVKEAIASKGAKALERTAHTLKGSCGNLGAQGMSRICKDLEEAGRTADWGRAGALLPGLEEEYLRVKAELELEKARG